MNDIREPYNRYSHACRSKPGDHPLKRPIRMGLGSEGFMLKQAGLQSHTELHRPNVSYINHLLSHTKYIYLLYII